jgi:thioesterase domain-containing protein
MRIEATPGSASLQRRIDDEFALARHIGVVVEQADEAGIILSAPLGSNANHQGTAFGGSLFSIAVLTGWAWVTRHVEARKLPADAVIQESTIVYLKPVHGGLRAASKAPSAERIEKFERMLKRAGRGRIRLEVEIHEGGVLATRFEGIFAAALR